MELKNANKTALESYRIIHEMAVFEQMLAKPFFICLEHKGSISKPPRIINYAQDGDCI